MNRSKYTGRTCSLFTQTGLVASILVTAAGIVAVEQSVHADGAVRCWGNNQYGERDTPADLGPCSTIAGGFTHTIALRSDGSVRCWGWNVFEQCNTPADLGPCSSVAGGFTHTIALRSDGSVRCWGQNSEGQCNTPADLGKCSSVAGGWRHTNALRSDGGVRCWGDNLYGQCNTPADLGPCSSVAGGGRHTVALRSDGGVRCWGQNSEGQCNTPADLGPCSSIAGGSEYTIAISAPAVDTDGDGRPDATDNCPNIANPTQSDCNLDGVGDACELAAGALDLNQDTIPDTCQCIADLFVDRQVNGADLGALLSQWGPANSNTISDLNRDGQVNGADLGILLNAWGPCRAAVVPAWATLIEAEPNPAAVTDAALRAAITATNIAWRVRDNGTGIEMLLVPPGVFQMGCPNLCYSQDNPVHTVTLTNPFYIGRYEVTQAQWSATLGSNPSYFSNQPGSANFPVEMVSWNDINGFLIATGMRMPTEAEWEFACRAGTTTAFYNGSEVGSLGAIAWWHNNSGGRTHAVGERLPNALGLFDMLGNVWEWVSDWYGPIPTDAVTNPTGANQPYYPDWGHVRRGGSFSFDICDPTESWARACDGNGINAGAHVGFRAARSP